MKRTLCHQKDRQLQSLGKFVEQFWFVLGDISEMKGVSGTKLVGIVDKAIEE